MTGLNQEVQFSPDKPWQLLWVLARTKSLSSTSFRVPSQSCQRPRWPGLLGTRGMSRRHEGQDGDVPTLPSSGSRPYSAGRGSSPPPAAWEAAAPRAPCPRGAFSSSGPRHGEAWAMMCSRSQRQVGRRECKRWTCAPWKGFTSTSGTGAAVDNRIFFFF